MVLNFIAALMGGISVMFSALKAHYFAKKLAQPQLEVLATGVYFALFHIPLFLYLNNSSEILGVGLVQISAKIMLAGVFAFSGSIYLFTLKPALIKVLGMMTPLGGVFLIVSWIALAVSFIT